MVNMKRSKDRTYHDEVEKQHEKDVEETNRLISAEDAIETSIYLENAPDCCSGAEKLSNVLGMLGANVTDEDIYHDPDEHSKICLQ